MDPDTGKTAVAINSVPIKIPNIFLFIFFLPPPNSFLFFL